MFAGEYSRYGYHAAAYARAVDAATRPPLHVVLVGPKGHPDLWPLQQAAWRVPVPGKAVEWLEDGTARGYPAAPGGNPRAYVCIGTNCTVVTDPNSPAWGTMAAPSPPPSVAPQAKIMSTTEPAQAALYDTAAIMGGLYGDGIIGLKGAFDPRLGAGTG